MAGRSILAALAVLGACQPATSTDGGEPISERPRPLTEPPVVRAPPPLSEAAQAKVDEILGTAGRGSLRRFARLAEAETGFTSNFADEGHYAHWDLLRRTGVDPLSKAQEVLDEPYDAISVGEETWFIWPDLAARSPDKLLPEKLSFQDRARLEAFVGETGLQQIRDGSPYPGFRLAVAASGRWVYFLHDIGEPEDP